jgi:hypothetical protein
VAGRPYRRSLASRRPGSRRTTIFAPVREAEDATLPWELVSRCEREAEGISWSFCHEFGRTRPSPSTAAQTVSSRGAATATCCSARPTGKLLAPAIHHLRTGAGALRRCLGARPRTAGRDPSANGSTSIMALPPPLARVAHRPSARSWTAGSGARRRRPSSPSPRTSRTPTRGGRVPARLGHAEARPASRLLAGPQPP